MEMGCEKPFLRVHGFEAARPAQTMRPPGGVINFHGIEHAKGLGRQIQPKVGQTHRMGLGGLRCQGRLVIEIKGVADRLRQRCSQVCGSPGAVRQAHLIFEGIRREKAEVGVSGVTANGESANGSYTMQDGTVYTFEGGAVTSINQPQEEESEEMQALKQEIENLKSEKSEIENKLNKVENSLKEEKEKVLTFEAQAKDFKTEFDNFKNQFKQEKANDNKPEEDSAQNRSFSWKK